MRLVAFIITLIIPLQLIAEDWMRNLDDNTPLGVLSIPGSHDAGTGNGFTEEYKTLAQHYATTQECSLSQQWQHGVRAFDLRPAVLTTGEKQELHIFHGIMRTNLSYESAIRLIIDSLKAHPSEFAIIIQRHETDADDNNRDWAKLMYNTLTRKGIREYLIDYNPYLTVGDMRGKLLILSRTHYADTPVGGYIEDWTSSEEIEKQTEAYITGKEDKGSLYVQDYYETIGDKMKQKLKCIKRMLYCIKSSAIPHPIIINHASGYSAVDIINGIEMATTNGYRHNASVTNRALIKYLKKHKESAGIIMMDLSGINLSGRYKVQGLELTKTIIQHNFIR